MLAGGESGAAFVANTLKIPTDSDATPAGPMHRRFHRSTSCSHFGYVAAVAIARAWKLIKDERYGRYARAASP